MNNVKNKFGTSFREQVIFYYIQRFFPDAVNRYKYPSVGELDIYIASLNLAIEYDGSRWHESRLKRDNEKNARAEKLGIKLVRIREYTLPSTNGAYGEICLPKKTYDSYDVSYLNKIFSEFGEIIGFDEIREYHISRDDYKKELPGIYSKIYDVPLEGNLEDMCGIELWDNEFNGCLNPENIPQNEWAYAILRCKDGRNVELPRYHREFRSQCLSKDKNACEKCISGVICPLIKWCCGKDNQVIDCKVVDNVVHKMINKGQPYNNLEQATYLYEWMWRKSTLGVRLIEEFLLLEKNSPLRKNYYRFFNLKTEEDGTGVSYCSILVRNEEEKKLLEKFAAEATHANICVQLQIHQK